MNWFSAVAAPPGETIDPKVDLGGPCTYTESRNAMSQNGSLRIIVKSTVRDGFGREESHSNGCKATTRHS